MVLLQDSFASYSEWFLNAAAWLRSKTQQVILQCWSPRCAEITFQQLTQEYLWEFITWQLYCFLKMNKWSH